MGSYSVSLAPSARKELRQLPTQDLARVHQKIVHLASNPRPHGSEKLAGSDDVYRFRQGDYRVVYEVDDSVRQVTVLRVRHRREAYR
jgi:mRNA interferase RelE/StbE